MKNMNRVSMVALALCAILLVTGCERPPPTSVQQGFRGTGMVAVDNPRTQAALKAANIYPEQLPPAVAAGPLAKDVYKNVQVLTDLTVPEFIRQMTSQANWVAPKEQCAYCHNLNDFASDEKYTKVVARRMLQMTRNINMNWQKHTLQTGVNCYTCHRGNPVPQYVWYDPVPPRTAPGMLGNRMGQNYPTKANGLTGLPWDPVTPFLVKSGVVRVMSPTALPTGQNPADIKAAEDTYSLMFLFSGSLGVNCTHCHNSQEFGSWLDAPPPRVNAWYAIRMVREVNNVYVMPLKSILPASRMGPMGDTPKVYCMTCHQGQPKPMNGVSVLASSPELAFIHTAPSAVAAPADGAAAAPVATGTTAPAAPAAPPTTGAM